MKQTFSLTLAGLLVAMVLFLSFAGTTGCRVKYSFTPAQPLPDSIKTVRVAFIENRAPYQNPQLSPNLTDRLRQKVVNQTKLRSTNNEDAHFTISGEIRTYSVTTSGVTSTNGTSQASINRLTVGVHVVINKVGKIEEYDVSRSFDFSANQTLQAAEVALLDEMVRNLTDEIFNRIFSDW